VPVLHESALPRIEHRRASPHGVEVTDRVEGDLPPATPAARRKRPGVNLNERRVDAPAKSSSGGDAASLVHPLTDVLVYLIHKVALGIHICNEGDARKPGLVCDRGQSPSFVPGDA